MKKYKTIIEYLNDTIGGNWKYLRAIRTWIEEDSGEYVHRVRICGHDDDCKCPTKLCYYARNHSKYLDEPNRGTKLPWNIRRRKKLSKRVAFATTGWR